VGDGPWPFESCLVRLGRIGRTKIGSFLKKEADVKRKYRTINGMRVECNPYVLKKSVEEKIMKEGFDRVQKVGNRLSAKLSKHSKK